MAGAATSLSSHDLSPSVEANEGDTGTASFFNTEYKKHGDLREMLDSNKDNLKLDAMRRLISMLAKGRDVSDLFPAVVKNVASKNIEVKKLVYVYLTRYAEEQQDLALLSISTFQRALKDPNQLIRASALRVLSSIRVQMIVPIMLLAIRESAVDMSPFVRKTAAHAIPKLYSLEPEMKEELIAVLEKLLADRTTLVIGSAVMAFEEVCPDMNELIHKNYRKLVSLLVDVEEWGQIVIVNMLTRYARTQFTDPNLGHTETPDMGEDEGEFYENSDDEDETAEEVSKPLYKMDPDHRLLLRSTKPLLQSRNASVVMATAQLYWHLAPRAEVQVVAKSLVRLLRSHNEVQAIVLNSIASMTIKSQGGAKMFQPYLRQFFVRGTDPSQVLILLVEGPPVVWLYFGCRSLYDCPQRLELQLEPQQWQLREWPSRLSIFSLRPCSLSPFACSPNSQGLFSQSLFSPAPFSRSPLPRSLFSRSLFSRSLSSRSLFSRSLLSRSLFSRC